MLNMHETQILSLQNLIALVEGRIIQLEVQLLLSTVYGLGGKPELLQFYNVGIALDLFIEPSYNTLIGSAIKTA